MKRCGQMRALEIFSPDYGIVSRGSAGDVVRLDGQHFLQSMGGAVTFQSPNLHFSEPLASSLGLSSQRLLGDKRIRPDGSHINLAHRLFLVKKFSRPAVAKFDFTVFGQAGFFKLFSDFIFRGSVETWRNSVITEFFRRPAKMSFQNLADVHTTGHAQRVKNNVHRRAVFQIRHILQRQYFGNNAFVAVPTGQFVADGNFSQFGDFNMDLFDYPRLQLVSHISGKNFDSDDPSLLAVVKSQGSVFNVSGSLAENRTQKSFFRSQLHFPFGRNFPDQDIVRPHFGADSDDAVLIQIFKFLFADIGYVVSGYLRPELGVSDVYGKSFQVDGSEFVFFDHSFRKDDSVLKVGSFPGQKSDQNILPQSHSPPVAGIIIRQNIAFFNLIADIDNRPVMRGR